MSPQTTRTVHFYVRVAPDDTCGRSVHGKNPHRSANLRPKSLALDQRRDWLGNPYPDRITNSQWELLLRYLERCSERFPGNSWPQVGSRWVHRGVAWQEIGPALCLERATGPRDGIGDRRCDEVGQCLLLLLKWEQDIILGVVAESLGVAPEKLWAQMRRYYRVKRMDHWGRLIPRVVGRLARVMQTRGIE